MQKVEGSNPFIRSMFSVPVSRRVAGCRRAAFTADEATWPSGLGTVCKTRYTGSTPVVASSRPPRETASSHQRVAPVILSRR